MLTKEQKIEVVKNLKQKLRDNKLVVFCNFEGVPVENQRKLRKAFKKDGGEIFVIKKRLVERMLLEEKIEFPKITGSVIVGFSKDEILSAKIFYNFITLIRNDFARTKEKVEFIGGVLKEDEGYKVLNKEEIKEIAQLPSKEEILARLVGTLKAPITNLQSVLKGNLQKLVYIFANIQD